MREGYWMIRTYEAGAVGEKTKYFVPGVRPSTASSRKAKSAIKKQEQNEYASVKALARLLNANYAQGDILLGLDYSDAGLSRVLKRAELTALPEEEDEEGRLAVWDAAEQEAVNCLRRVKRLLQKDGVELRYILVTSDLDGQTLERVRIHHHLIINREAVEAFGEKWAALGGVDFAPLSKQKDYTPIAEYLLRQVWHRKDARSYVSSRNLIRPEPRDRIAISESELRVPKGAELLYRGAHIPGQAQYIRYFLMEPAHARGGENRGKKKRE